MTDRRHKDANWHLNPNADGTVSNGDAQLAVLMDIRDELKIVSRKLSALECRNFIDIPIVLRQIRRNTTKRKRPAAGKPKLRVVR